MQKYKIMDWCYKNTLLSLVKVSAVLFALTMLAPALKGVCPIGTGSSILRIKTLWSSCLVITIKSTLRVKHPALVLRKKINAAGQSIFFCAQKFSEGRVIIIVIIQL